MDTNKDGVLTFDTNRSNELQDLLGEALRTETGKAFLKDYFVSEKEDEYSGKWIKALEEFTNPNAVTVDQAARVLQILCDAGEFDLKVLPPPLPVEPEPQSVDDRPRSKSGKLLTQAQIDWSEMTHFLAENDMETVNRRRRDDAKFAAFCVHNLKAEMNQEVGGAVTPAGAPAKRRDATVALSTFVRAFQRASTASLKPVAGLVHLGDEAVPVATFNNLLSKAREAGLI